MVGKEDDPAAFWAESSLEKETKTIGNQYF